MQFRDFGKWMIACAMLISGALFSVGEAAAQMNPEEEQRCVWQCLANSPGAASRQYQDCVDRMCTSRPPEKIPLATPAPRVVWKSGKGAGNSHFAGVESNGKSFSFLCKRGGPGLFAIAGFRGPADAMAFRIDGQDYGLPFIAQNGIYYTNATSHLIKALMSGKAVHIANKQTRVSGAFSLAGSSAAIGNALAGCKM
ncbi:MAG: hypothetical protein KF874_06815 [Rhizobiaceae bacterium]|nr:hypothetical protein [Rhizobiaceae bacterium]